MTRRWRLTDRGRLVVAVAGTLVSAFLVSALSLMLAGGGR